MTNFHSIMRDEAGYLQLLEAIRGQRLPFLASGLSDIHKAHIIYSLFCELDEPAHILVPNESMGNKLTADINTLLGYEGAFFFPTKEFVFRDIEGSSLEFQRIRLGVLGRILTTECPLVVSTIEAAAQLTLSRAEYLAQSKTLRTGESIDQRELVEFLLRAGYERAEKVEGCGQFSVRGGILDIFQVGTAEPTRLEFWGDEIDTMAQFDSATQRRLEQVDKIVLTPAKEALIVRRELFIKKLRKHAATLQGKHGLLAKAQIEKDCQKLQDEGSLPSADRYFPLLYSEQETLFDYTKGRLLFLCEPAGLREAYKNSSWQFEQDTKILLGEGILSKGCDTFLLPLGAIESQIQHGKTVLMDTFNRSLPDLRLAELGEISALQLPAWTGDFAQLVEDLRDYTARGYRTVVLAGTKKAADALTNDLIGAAIPIRWESDFSSFPAGTVCVSQGLLTAGFEYPQLQFALMTQSRLTTEQKKKRRPKEGKKLRTISDLTLGDYVVHATHGIGVFDGIIKREIQGIIKDYIKIRYAGTDALFVPVTQLELVNKYIGAAEGVSVRLNRLHSAEWTNTKNKVRGAVKEMAQELTALYAKRHNTKGYAFSPDGDWQQEFEARFPYEETEDQLESVREIKADMERAIPMDRLLCGDVGFGKTEVALRAIFKCIADGKQAAVLVPTTILAWQHYQTFLQRLKGYPVTIELLSRFRTPKQQKEILKKLKTGEVDVVIGTHRVIQKDVEFKDLALCIIDEEQRFGVGHKEKFKEMRTNIDVLTLTATPIPRTLNMAMSGIRDMSLIEEAPQNRYPVQTYVLEHDDGVIVQAIERELRRNGQVFYLHNRVDSIQRKASSLQEQLPNARIGVAHGRMGETEMSEVWRKLVEHEIDILVCTTIIETGVDVPNCNTLVIESADNYGLSQLYQLRGRVGRSARRAYAYFTFRKGKALSEIATKRLSAIRQFTTFGSGFQIAMRDLELRGAGNVLGASQHGHMSSVGYDLYLRLLAEAVQEESGEEVVPTTESVIDLAVDAYIPEEYIEDLSQRMDMYKKIAYVSTVEESMDLIDEFIDRFGELPRAVLGLIEVSLVRGMASRLGILEASQKEQRILLYPAIFDLLEAQKVAGTLQGRMMINASNKPYYSVRIQKGQTPTNALKEALETIASVKKQITDSETEE